MPHTPGAAAPAPSRPAEERDRLVQDNLRLVFACLSRYYPCVQRKSHRWDDMVSVGLVALLRAATLFDPSMGFRFSTFACVAIRREVGRALHVEIRDRAARLPSTGDDEPAGSAVADPRGVDPADAAAESDADDARRRAVEDALRHLPEQRRRAVELRQLQGLTLDDAAEAMGLSRERVRQLELRGLQRLASVPGLIGHLPA